MLFLGLGIPISAFLADKYGRNRMLVLATIGIMLFGLIFAFIFIAGNTFLTGVFLSLGMFLMGLSYGPIGTALAGIFPAPVRYT